ncbi:DUF805 domain-containing protein [Pelagibacterium montanilacus]|uniref:DUF805 domain-containing protein n=1 Tax=Pelagibacterium montanilacus TaxID=2185280 RepID=UPI000F8E7123|nr:DUF805 domain-containing protein [Pelagibacterium montanilacus]
MELFTSFHGRIGRRTFWLGMIGLVVLGIVLGLVIAPLGLVIGAGLASLLLSLLLLYPASAIITKRLADRGKPQTPWLWIFVVPGLVLNAMQALGIGFEEMEMAGEHVIQPVGIGMVMSGIVAIVALWALIELGLLKGRK